MLGETRSDTENLGDYLGGLVGVRLDEKFDLFLLELVEFTDKVLDLDLGPLEVCRDNRPGFLLRDEVKLDQGGDECRP